jgi:Leucine rich repeat/Leucine Rich Repeat
MSIVSGPIPTEFFELASTLKEVYMDYNSFSGTFPDEIASLTSLTDFYAYDSDFTGTIPTEFGLITSLETLVLAENLFSGSIPSQFSQLPFLAVFSVYRRDKPGPMLSGSLPAFDKVPKLTDLYLDGNDLSGAIPANFLASSDYASLVVLSHMQLEGAVPEGIGRLNKLNIQLEGNAITSFPLSFCNNSDWMDGQIFRAGCNAFLCPPGWANSMGRANQTMPCEECAGEGIGIFYGTLSCAAPFTERSVLIKLHQQCGGSAWHRMDGWTTTTPLCKWYGITCNAKGSVESINLGNNNLVGTLNSEIFDLVNLKSLWLHSNPIDVNFKNIGSAKKLTELRLDATNVNRLDNLNLARTMTLLDLRFNQLPGVFPRQILKLTNLRSLNLGDNQFSGPLPASFIDLKYLRILRLGSNKFSGKIPSFEDMNLLDTLDLSGNFLTGTIPAAFLNRITTTANLEVDLSSNQLSGTIPAELDRFDRVTFYLRDNKIVGLPEVFCNNVDWNDGDVESHGCNGILCPPGTFSIVGRARGVQTCLPCGDDVPFYGQDKCRLPMSSASRMMTWLGTIALLACISWI